MRSVLPQSCGPAFKFSSALLLGETIRHFKTRPVVKFWKVKKKTFYLSFRLAFTLRRVEHKSTVGPEKPFIGSHPLQL